MEQILVFCRRLRGANVGVTTANVLDLFQSLNYLDIAEKQSFYYAARAHLVSSREDLSAFDLLFQEFWGSSPPPAELLENLPVPAQKDETGKEASVPTKGEGGRPGGELKTTREERGGREEGAGTTTESHASFFLPPSPLGYSPLETLATKDFGELEPEEAAWIQRHLHRVVPRLFTLRSRRKSGHFRGAELDLRKTLRRSLKHGGQVTRLFRRQRKIKKNQLLLLCDVSGSMDAYSRFLIQFIHTMQSRLSRVETWVFSTRITRVTEFLKASDLSQALAKISKKVTDWSGGTNIGGCLSVFNRTVGRRFVSRRTVVIIISDGWDRGEVNLLAQEMQRLKRNAYKIIWLNPLLGLPNYRPVNKGMAAALPYVDYFLPAHNLESLIALGKLIQAFPKIAPRAV